MAHVYTRERGDVVERAFLRLLGQDASGDQNWKQYGGSVVVFTIAFSASSTRCCVCRATSSSTPTTCRACPGTSR